jgi:hypothetical protein
VRAKYILFTIVALFAIVGGSLLAYRQVAVRRPATCQICGRDVPRQTGFRLETSGGTVVACCPTCAMHYMLHHPGTVRQAMATDFTSGRTIPAATAYYDEGGDVQYCTAHHPSVERGQLGVSTRVYDRCLPTLVAFKERSEAEAYQKLHGGRVLTYDQALESVRAE